MLKMPLADALNQLEQYTTEFHRVLDHGDWDVGIYRPESRDSQTAHQRDELYVVAVGQGTFFYDGERQPFRAGDAFFVPAGIDHRFEDFSDDFAAWVIFFGTRPH
jgi:mannose-6-phosphate isomerase-like protein (cupin superfamily)